MRITKPNLDRSAIVLANARELAGEQNTQDARVTVRLTVVGLDSLWQSLPAGVKAELLEHL